ncbi:MAG TPA: bifunctional riboflavin kinase/FAD synthetase [Solirubrobacterales bacterium]|nr:bifunctional riboflavin kinase/FAD synthetase [Solirubrobacterales bacterium]
MDVYRSLAELPPAPAGRSIALGTFDGVHRGHRGVIEAAVEGARANGLRPAVVTFDPHPLQVLTPGDAPQLLTTTGTKAALVAQLGVEELLAIPFTAELSQQTPEEFCEQVLAGALDARRVAVGENFRFGRGASGDAELLRARKEFETVVVPLVEYGDEPVSSSRIRELVSAGDVSAAAELLASPYRLVGDVMPGDARGRELGMPTINLGLPPESVIPAPGIYAGRAHGDTLGANVPAAISIGVRPTFEDAGDLRVEAYLIGFDGDLYGQTVTLEFLERLRDEVKFDSVEALQRQMRADVEQTEKIAGSTR